MRSVAYLFVHGTCRWALFVCMHCAVGSIIWWLAFEIRVNRKSWYQLSTYVSTLLWGMLRLNLLSARVWSDVGALPESHEIISHCELSVCAQCICPYILNTSIFWLNSLFCHSHLFPSHWSERFWAHVHWIHACMLPILLKSFDCSEL